MSKTRIARVAQHGPRLKNTSGGILMGASGRLTPKGERIVLRASVQRLAAYLAEAHAPEATTGHGGDGWETCTYCTAIKEANALIRWGNPR